MANEMGTKPQPKLELKEQGPNENKEEGDIEAGKLTTAGGGGALYPDMAEDPKLRWAFIRKVYLILIVQFLVTAAIATTFNRVRPIPNFIMRHSKASIALFVVLLILPFIVLFPMLIFRRRHPINMIFLGIYTLCISLLIGWIAAILKGWFLLEAAFVTTGVLTMLTLYTFWAARRGSDFGFLAPFLLVSSLVLLLYLVMQFFWVHKALLSIYGCLATIVFSGFIIFDTDNLIKRHKYDEYTTAAISLYLDVINLFLAILFVPSFEI